MSAAPNLPTVTVLVIAYRMAGTIAQALESALAQTYPCRIVVSDDCSGDATLAIAQSVIAAYRGPHRVSARSTARNLGLCAHLNDLAAQTDDEVLMFLAGDDIAYPQRAEKLAAVFAADPRVQLAGSAVDDIDADGRLLAACVRALPERTGQEWFLRRGKMATVLGASMAIRRELLTRMPPLAGVVEDNMLTLRAALAGECVCLGEALLGYRRHANNLGDWVFDRRTGGYAGFAQRQRRVLAMYRDIAADQERCVAARPDLPAQRRQRALQLARMYRLEADMREAILDRPRAQWIAPLWRGLCHPGLRRKSAERALKLFVPRRWFGRG